MHPEERVKAHINRIKKMGLVLILLAIVFSTVAFLVPIDELHYWSSTRNKEGIYVLSAFIGFLGLYCFGAVWRRGNFI